MRRRDGEIEFEAPQFRARARMLAGLLALTALVLIGRSVQLQVFDQQFIAKQADMRHARTAKLEAHRGAIVDRFGEPLAVSSPVDTVWVNPPEFAEAGDGIAQLARALKLNRQWLGQRVTSNLDRDFLYVARHLEPDEAAKIRKLGIPGVYFLREYKRFYPNGEVTGHLLGFTNLDEAGLEGLEFAYDRSLAGMDGAKRVLVNGRGQVIQNVEVLKAPLQGEDLVTSIDLRDPVPGLPRAQGGDPRAQRQARAPSIVLDIATGEVLAMVNQPSFNPNDRTQYEVSRYRNRAVTDIFEPGSSIKPFVVAAALASGRYTATSTIDAMPVQGRLADSSATTTTSARSTWARCSRARATSRWRRSRSRSTRRRCTTRCRASASARSPRAASRASPRGSSSSTANWKPINIATMAYGYGLSVTPLQLAQAYATIGAFGLHRPVTFRRAEGAPAGERVLQTRVARDLLGLLEQAVTPAGTGAKAAVPGYRVAGKTGTAWKAIPGGYSRATAISRCSAAWCRRARRASPSSSWSTSRRATSTTAATSRRRCSRR